MTEAFEEEVDLEILTTMADASAEEAEETALPSERLQRGRRRCVYSPR